MKKALLVIAALLCNLLLESIVFVRINLWGLLPDSIIAVVATIALVGGGRKAGAYGVAAGLLIGILFGKYIGLEALIYLLLALLCLPRNLLALAVIGALGFLLAATLPMSLIYLLLIGCSLTCLVACFCAYGGIRKHVLR